MRRNKNEFKELEVFNDLNVLTPSPGNAVEGDHKSVITTLTGTAKPMNFKIEEIKTHGEKVQIKDKYLQYMEIYNLKFQNKIENDAVAKTDDDKKKIATLYKRFAAFKRDAKLKIRGRAQLNTAILENKTKKVEEDKEAKRKLRQLAKKTDSALYQKNYKDKTVTKIKRINIKKLTLMKRNKQMKKRRKVNVNFLTMMLNNETRDFMTSTTRYDNWKQSLEIQLINIIDKQNIDYENIFKSLVLEMEDGFEDPTKSRNYEDTGYDDGLYYFNTYDTNYRGGEKFQNIKKFKDVNKGGNKKDGFNMGEKKERKEVLFKIKEDLEKMAEKTKKYEEDIKSFNEPNKPTPIPDKKELNTSLQALKDSAKRYESYKVKQRMINFTLKTFNKLDLKSLLEHWIVNAKNLKKKKKPQKEKKRDENDGKNKADNDEENFRKKENSTNIKCEFKLPDSDIVKLIPFCTNIFTITKNDN